MEKTLSKYEEAFWLAVFFAAVVTPIALMIWGLSIAGPAIAILAGAALFFVRPLIGLTIITVILCVGALM